MEITSGYYDFGLGDLAIPVSLLELGSMSQILTQ